MFQKKTIRRGLWVIAVILFVGIGPFTITHEFGPYFGKVTDMNTGQPIEGAYVLVAYFNEMYTLGGFVGSFVDMTETWTNNNGEFSIESKRVWAFSFPKRWQEDCFAYVFKGGYAPFPYHESATVDHIPSWSLPTNRQATIKLSKLSTYQERLRGLERPIPVPFERLQNLNKLIDAERKQLGLK